MLIDINLLPKPPKQSPVFYAVVSGLIALSLIASIWLYLDYKNVIQAQEMTEQRLETTKQLVEIEQTKLSQIGVTGAATKLEEMVTWLEQVPVSSVVVINHLTEMLPARGFFQTVSYGDSGSVSLEVQFDNLYEISGYLFQLEQSSWVKGAELTTVVTSEVGEDIIPRYLANYIITLNMNAIKADEKEAD